MLPPELIVTIEKIGENQYLAKTIRGDNQAEICSHTFTYAPDHLIDLEPQWMLNRAVPRGNVDTVVRKEGETQPELTQAEKLAGYGQRLFGLLFGDGERLKAFLDFNDQYRRQARLTLKMHRQAAVMWRLPWEYLHDTSDILTLHGRFLLSRVPYGVAELEPPTAPLPLRILVVISAPDDQATLDTEEEIGVIQTALDEAVRANRVQVQYLDDATLPAIGDTLRRFQPHILHYTGHGIYKARTDPDKLGRSYLALETDDGHSKLADIADLRPYLKEATDLRLVFLSGCQTAQTSPDDAFSGVATGLLRENIPAVLAMQFSILDPSAIELARAFYSRLAQGDVLSQAMHRARLAMRDFEDGPGYDWGIPALYLRAQGMRLSDPEAQPVEPTIPTRLIDMAGLPLPPHFVGRKKQLRALRRALKDRRVTSAFIRGIGGVGKSSIAAKLLERPGIDLDGAFVIRCHEVDPLDIPAKLASFLNAQGKANHAEAAGLLLDSRQPPAARARQAAAMIDGQRYIFVFDNFESVMVAPTPSPSPSKGEGSLPDPSPAEGEGSPPAPSPSEGEGSPRSGRGEGDSAFPVADPDLSGLLTGLLQAR